jgi:hypothetical protein
VASLYTLIFPSVSFSELEHDRGTDTHKEESNKKKNGIMYFVQM